MGGLGEMVRYAVWDPRLRGGRLGGVTFVTLSGRLGLAEGKFADAPGRSQG